LIRIGSCGEIWNEFVVLVVPGCEQFSAQQRRAVPTWEVLAFILALAQQSIIAQSFSPECIGSPAKTLPAITARRKKDVDHFAITSRNYIEPLRSSQPEN
jgi:hypothetical protein